jgi:hypothetical protein
VRAAGGSARVWGRFEAEVSFEVAGAGARGVEVEALVRTPSGGSVRVPGFVDARGRWRVRYMPLEAGRHSYEVSVSNAAGRRLTLPASFSAAGREPRGPVRVAREDPRHFELASGEPFYPVGTNVAWAKDFEPFFREFAEAGGNLVRVWLAPWSLPVASRRAAGEVDLAAAERLEETLDFAWRHGLVVQLVLTAHWEFAEGWAKNAYSSANGGPCARPADFFTGAGARRAFRMFLCYVAARYASHPALFAWELVNEADLVPGLSERDAVDWHREMARFLRAEDPVARPITTSTSTPAWRPGGFPLLASIPEIDFLQTHAYGPGVDAAVLDHADWRRSRAKPAFIGEFGADTERYLDQADSGGVRLRTMLWLSLASSSSGTAMPWWWDVQVMPNDLFRHWRPVAALARRIDRRGRRWTFVRRRLGGREGRVPATTVAHGIVSRDEGLLYFYDPRVLDDPARPGEVLPLGGAVEVKGLIDGAYEIELWRTDGPGPAETRGGTAVDGRLVLGLPASDADFAVRFRAVGSSEPGIAE